MGGISGRYCIVGVGHTSWGSLPGLSTEDMCVEAIRRALADANIDKRELDGILTKTPTSRFEMMYSCRIAQRLGIQPSVLGSLDQGGATNISLIHYAISCIEAGMCRTVAIVSADNPKSGTRQAYEKPWGTDGVFGWVGIPAAYAMIARRHMELYGTRPEHLGAVAKACRRHGALNPHAQLRKPITIEDYLNSPMIVEPLRRDDCALISDGGAAIIVTSLERARAWGHRDPPTVLGLGQAHQAWDLHLRPEITRSGAVESGRQAFAMAGLRPADVDVAQIYDCFTITVIVTLEDYGFCEKGEGGAFVEGGRIELGGDLPVNTGGGLLSETGLPGMQLIVEAVRQLRGECGDRQVPNARVALVSNQGGVMTTHSTLLLGR